MQTAASVSGSKGAHTLIFKGTAKQTPDFAIDTPREALPDFEALIETYLAKRHLYIHPNFTERNIVISRVSSKLPHLHCTHLL